ncbi:SPX domain-containing protein [Paraphysoderma sedebokerense]|nr:SPX domain-containing protein [Paraphysoderma sedebokerense]
MKFAKTLKNEAISEWETKYIDYRNLKKLLKKIKQRTKDESIILTVSAASSPENAPSQVQNSSQPHLPIPKTPSSTNISPIMMPSPQMQLQEKQGRLIPKRPETPKSMKALMLPDAILQSPSRDPTTFPIPESPRFVRNLLNKRKSLKDMGSTESSPSTMTLETYLNSATPEEREFFAALDQELKKVEEFYCSKEDEAIIQSRSISYQADLIRRNKKSKSNKSNKNDNDESVNSSSSSVPMINRIFHVNRLSFSGSEDTNQKFFRRPSYAASAIEDNEEVPVMQKHTVKKALMEHYRSMQLLKNYKILNYTGFAKILKKFDKVAGWDSSPLYFNEKLHTTRWG